MSEEEKRREEILKARAENRRLSEMIVQGSEYHAPVKVRTIDRQERSVEVYALSEADFQAVFEASGVDPRKIGDQDALVANLKFLGAIAKIATKDPDITKVLMPNESAKIMMKAFELSGLTGTPKFD